MLVRILIDGEFHEVRADAAVIQQSVALAWSAIARHALPGTLAPMRNSRKSLRTVATCAAKPSWPWTVSRPAAASAARTRTTEALTWSADADGTDQMRIEPPWVGSFDIDHCEISGGEDPLGGQQREVGEVLVVDGVVLVALDEPEQVRNLDAHKAGVRDQSPQPLKSTISGT